MGNRNKVTSGTFSDGSFGIRAKENGGIMRVWFCGAAIKPGVNAPFSATGFNNDRPCAHATRQEARDCKRVTRF